MAIFVFTNGDIVGTFTQTQKSSDVSSYNSISYCNRFPSESVNLRSCPADCVWASTSVKSEVPVILMSTGKSVRSVVPPISLLCMVIIFLNFQSSLHAVEEISHQSEIVPGMTLFTSAVNPRVSGSVIDSSAVSSSAAVSPRDSGSEMLIDLTGSTVSVNPRDSDGVMVNAASVSIASDNPRDSVRDSGASAGAGKTSTPIIVSLPDFVLEYARVTLPPVTTSWLTPSNCTLEPASFLDTSKSITLGDVADCWPLFKMAPIPIR